MASQIIGVSPFLGPAAQVVGVTYTSIKEPMAFSPEKLGNIEAESGSAPALIPLTAKLKLPVNKGCRGAARGPNLDLGASGG